MDYKKLLKSRKGAVILWVAIFIVLYVSLLTYISYHESQIDIYSQNEGKKAVHDTAVEIIRNSTTDEEKILSIYEWVNKSIKYELYPCERVGSSKDSPWILKTKCGGCGEFAIIFSALANSVGIDTRIISDPGEDHVWNEVLINDEWKVIEPTWGYPDGYFKTSYSNRDSSVNVSFVLAEESNGSFKEITERYTNTGVINVSIFGNPSKNYTIIIISEYLSSEGKSNKEATRCTIVSGGNCSFNLGGNNYTIIVEMDNFWKLSEINRTELIENNSYNVLLHANSISLSLTLVMIPTEIKIIMLLLVILSFLLTLIIRLFFVKPINKKGKNKG